jgi:hypothetical protein
MACLRRYIQLNCLTKCIIIASVVCCLGEAKAQVDIQTPGLQYYNKCLNYAISTGNIRNSGGQIMYSCFGNIAESWFDYLDGGRNERDRLGLWVARTAGVGSQCNHQIEDAAGNGMSHYNCNIYAPAPQ